MSGRPTYKQLERDAEELVAQRDALIECLVRIRAAAKSDADLANLSPLRDFLLRETEAVEGYPWAILGNIPGEQTA